MNATARAHPRPGEGQQRTARPPSGYSLILFQIRASARGSIPWASTWGSTRDGRGPREVQQRSSSRGGLLEHVLRLLAARPQREKQAGLDFRRPGRLPIGSEPNIEEPAARSQQEGADP
jgi:hypothetical protein